MPSFQTFFVVIGLLISIAAHGQGSASAPIGSTQGIVFNQYWQIAMASPQTKHALTPHEASEIFRTLFHHPVAGLDRVQHYDPSGEIGFCFGRSMAAFLLARRAGLSIVSTRNLFIIGDLRSATLPEWRFHVTSLVKVTDGRWYAIDPIIPQGRPVLIQEWIETVRRIWDRAHRAKLYIVSPFEVMPDVRRMVSPERETGQNIIELRFDPEGQPGFQPMKLKLLSGSIEKIYLLSGAAAQRYFLSTTEPEPDRFQFDSLNINAFMFHFRGYFSDLLATLFGT